jgi:hypothetical protein
MQWFATTKLIQKHDEQKYILQTKHEKHKMEQMENTPKYNAPSKYMKNSVGVFYVYLR